MVMTKLFQLDKIHLNYSKKLNKYFKRYLCQITLLELHGLLHDIITTYIFSSYKVKWENDKLFIYGTTMLLGGILQT